MALDGGYLHHIGSEINIEAAGCRVEKIYQPNKDELILTFRGKSGQKKLLMSARANTPRVNFTQFAPENPKVPPMFCMLLRKRLAGARLKQVFQPGMERILQFEFDATNELGDPITLYLVAEIMGKYSNVIFLDGEKQVIDALKRVDITMSSRRLVLPGLEYRLPPAQDKINLLESTAQNVIDHMLLDEGDKQLSKALLTHIQGVSPIVCREIEYQTGSGLELTVKNMNENQRIKLKDILEQLADTIAKCSGIPHMVVENGKPLDFTFLNINQYEGAASIKVYESFSVLLDSFYQERDTAERMRVKAHDLHKLVSNTTERLSRKINTQQAELSRCVNREPLRIKGDLLQANLYRVEKGTEKILVENFYDNNKIIEIALNPAISPSQNAQKYYKDYRKAKTAEQILQQQIEKAQQELLYIATVADTLNRASGEQELNEIRAELTEQGYIRKRKGKQSKEKSLPPLQFVSAKGFTILVGRNNRQNDQLTLKQAKKSDLWFHTKEIPGSHTILLTGGKAPDDESVLYAAQLAAFHSKARSSSQVPVDYTQVKNVHKPQGAKPGMVIYVNNKTVYVAPSLEEYVEKQ